MRTTPRKQPRQARSQATVDVILDATARVLVRDGYDHCSTNRVALAAGVSIGSLYQYFPSKEALVAALIERHSTAMHAVFAAKIASLGDIAPEEAAREMIAAVVASHAVDPKLHRVLAEQVPRVGRLQRIHSLRASTEESVRAYLELRRDRVRDLDLELAAFVITHIVEGVVHSAVDDRPELLQGDRLVGALSEVVLRYLMPTNDGEGVAGEAAPKSGRGRVRGR